MSNFTFRRKSIVAASAILLSACAGQQVPIPSFPETGVAFGGPTVSIGAPVMVNCPFTRPDGTHFNFETTAELCNQLLLSGGEDEAGTTTQPTPSLAPAATLSPPVRSTLSDGNVPLEPDRVANQLYEDEGFEPFAYRLDETCHLGMGRVVTLADCIAVDTARAEAERVLQDSWARLSPVRQDAATVWCYWSACSTFTKAIEEIHDGVAGDATAWWKAAIEIYNSELKEIDRDRAFELAQTMGSGEWEFVGTIQSLNQTP